MASITTILGTDSLASSRILINDNFSSLDDNLDQVTGLLNVQTQSLALTGSVSASELNLTNGGSNLFVVNTSNITASLPVTLENTLILEGGLRHSVAAVSAVPTAGNYEKSTYLLDASGLAQPLVFPAGDDGQEVTIIADGSNVQLDVNNIAGPTAATILPNGTLTMRYYNGLLYLISDVNCTLTF